MAMEERLHFFNNGNGGPQHPFPILIGKILPGKVHTVGLKPDCHVRPETAGPPGGFSLTQPHSNVQRELSPRPETAAFLFGLTISIFKQFEMELNVSLGVLVNQGCIYLSHSWLALESGCNFSFNHGNLSLCMVHPCTTSLETTLYCDGNVVILSSSEHESGLTTSSA
ncbi:hypothetical protein RJT34_24526 [Clitoria ternatea]|uniref:Uncharacterized protein n=1 Tax=Clitoria ternatea TaxID=43366 RepID=A0AAN9IFZ6_CLITE